MGVVRALEPVASVDDRDQTNLKGNGQLKGIYPIKFFFRIISVIPDFNIDFFSLVGGQYICK